MVKMEARLALGKKGTLAACMKADRASSCTNPVNVAGKRCAGKEGMLTARPVWDKNCGEERRAVE